MARSALGRHAAWMVSGAGVQAVVAFLANLALVRLLMPEEFGRFAIVQANISLVTAVTNLKINDLLLREPEEELDQERLGLYLGALAFQTVAVGLGAVALLWAFDLLRFDATILLLSVLGGHWVHAQMTLFERQFDYRRISIIDATAKGTGQLFAVAGALAGLGGLVLYLRAAVQLIGQVAGLGWVGGLRRLPLRWLGVDEWKRVFGKIRGFWLDGVLAQSFERLVILMVGALVGERATGFFYQARMLATTPHRLAKPLTSRIAFNYFSHQVEPGNRRSVLRRTLGWEGAVLLVVAAGTFFLADPVVPWLFGSDWTGVVPLLRAMSGMIVALTTFNTLNAYFMSLGRMRPFIILGRGGQYLGFFAVAGTVALAFADSIALGMALGLSAAYVLGTVASGILATTRDLSALEA